MPYASGRTISTLLAFALVACSSATPGVSPTEAGDDDAASAKHGDDASDAHAKAVDAGASDAHAKDAGHDAVAAKDAGHDAAKDDAGTEDAGGAAIDASVDGEADGACTVEGITGTCITTTACAAMTGYTSTAGYCPGPADIECCTEGPSTADNPPPPAGWVLMQQSAVTPAMTSWAVMILNDPTDYPMYSTTTMMFGTQNVLAIVQWHPPDFQNSVVHRGVTLYVPS